MSAIIGLRREDKNLWERRVPLIPEHIRELKHEYSIEAILQPSGIRAFSDEEYIHAGAMVQEDISSCPIVFAIKEVPLSFFQPGKTYIFFSHTMKGQPHNMPVLRKLLELKCQLIDYEKVVDEKGKRLIFFGEHAGIAGMIDTLWAFGQRLNWEGIQTPFCEISQTYRYKSLNEAKEKITEVGKKIIRNGLHQSLVPLFCGVTGYGNVSRGAQEILDLLPIKEIAPEEISSIVKKPGDAKNIIYKIVFKEEHIVTPISTSHKFQLQDYYDHPEKYRSVFYSYLPYLTMIVNCIYWEKRYPRLVTKENLRDLYSAESKPRLRVIGDISCDIEGSMECTTHGTDSGNPIFVYNPLNGQVIDGFAGVGTVVMAVDNLPCEIPRESSTYFSQALKNFIPDITQADFSADFEQCKLPATIKNAVVVYQGKFTPNYAYLKKFL